MAPPTPDVPGALAVANLKGGVGKTTTAVFLAEAAATSTATPGLRVAVLDTDPQATAAKWAARAAEAGEPLAARYAQPAAGETVGEAVARLRGGADVVIIDTPPGAGDRDITLAAVRAADGMVVPCRASVVEADELRPALALAAEAGREAVVLRVAVDGRMTAAREFGDVLEGAGVAAFHHGIPYTAAIMRAGRTRPDPNRLFGYAWVWLEIVGADDGVTL